jgi:CHASE3 domain sensor protein
MMKWIQGFSRTSVLIALAVAFLAAQSVSAAGFLTLLHFRGSTNAVSRAQDVLLELESIARSLTLAETGQQGYVLTGAEHFLVPYRDSLNDVRGHLRRLIELTGDDAVQRRHVSDLVRQVDERVDQLGETIVTRHVDGVQAAGTVVLADYEKRRMDSIHRTVEEMRVKESQRLRSRSEDSTAWAITAGALSVVTFLLMFVVFGFSFVTVSLALGKHREPSHPLSRPQAVPPLG